MSSPSYTIAVTGAHGLLGSGFIRHALSLGHRILALDRKPLSFPRGPPSPPDSTDGENDEDDDCDIPPELSNSGITPLDLALLLKAISAHASSYAYTEIDLLDYDAFRRAVKDGGCDALVHLAAVYREHDGRGNYLEGGLAEHKVYSINTTMSYNALNIAAELGIERVVMASSVNSTGMLFSKQPRFDYLPMDESHPCYPEDAYSLAKQTSEIQASATIRRNPHLALRIASLRFHWVVPTPLANKATISTHSGSNKDLWGWVSVSAASEAVLLAITSPIHQFPAGHEIFFIVARTMCGGGSRGEAMGEFWRDVEWRGGLEGMERNEGLFDTTKAEMVLGWKEEGYPKA